MIAILDTNAVIGLAKGECLEQLAALMQVRGYSIDPLLYGKRPLNLMKEPGQVLRIVLVDPIGAWVQSAPQIEVAVAWQGM